MHTAINEAASENEIEAQRLAKERAQLIKDKADLATQRAHVKAGEVRLDGRQQRLQQQQQMADDRQGLLMDQLDTINTATEKATETFRSTATALQEEGEQWRQQNRQVFNQAQAATSRALQMTHEAIEAQGMRKSPAYKSRWGTHSCCDCATKS